MATMNLTEAYFRYLQNRQDHSAQAALLAQLADARYGLEADLFGQYIEHGLSVVNLAHGLWAGRRASIGLELPSTAQVGDLWFDLLEMTAMILLPAEGPEPGEVYAPEALARMSPFHGWMAVRPVANWQYATFLMLAKIGARQVQLPSTLRTLDVARILKGDQTDPVTGLTCAEALLYARWFGKGLCGQEEWQATARLLPRAVWEALWEPLRREWAGSVQESVCAVVSRENYDQDWYEIEGDDFDRPPEHRTLFAEDDPQYGVGFRTRVLSQFGLLRTPGSDPASMLNVELLEVLQRE